MELVALETSRIIYLTQVVRPEGQVYLPDAAAKLVERYSFVRHPSIEQIVAPQVTFAIGKFKDVQIDELQIYPDGIIVAARCNTAVLDEFVGDLFAWAKDTFGLIIPSTTKSEKFFESIVVVKSTKDLALSISPRNDVAQLFNDLFADKAASFRISGFTLDCDPAQFLGRRKPLRFTLERRAAIPFADNVFFSHAPLRTDDHLRLLNEIERI
jgi:hypothetical protein